MKKPIIITLIALLLGTGLHARLGETVKELKERYGEPLEKHEEYNIYEMHDFSIIVTLRDRSWGYVAVKLSYYKMDDYGEIEEIKSYEIKKLLDANFGKGNWKETDPNTFETKRRTGMKAIGVHHVQDGLLLVTDHEHLKNAMQDSKEKMDEKMDDF